MNGNDFDKVCIVDTSALIDYPSLIEELLAGDNLVYVPAIVHKELTGKKRDREADIGKDAREAISRMNQLRSANHPLLRTNRFPNWEGISKLDSAKSLERDVPDDIIIAVAISAYKEYPDKEIVLITHDQGMQLKARDMKDGKKQCLVIEECQKTKGMALEGLKTPKLELPDSISILSHSLLVKDIPGTENLLENGGAICIAQPNDGKPSETRPFIRKGSRLVAVPDAVSLFGVKPKPINGSGVNLEQMLAMQMLQDPRIVYYSMFGEAGSGKTLLALALALQLLDKGEIRYLYLTRAPVTFGPEQGFLPGDAVEKMAPWVAGMMDNIQLISELNPAKAKKIEFWLKGDSAAAHVETPAKQPTGKKVKKSSGQGEIATDKMERRMRIIILPYSHIRGRTYPNSVVLVDEAQNMRRQEILTFATRLGDGSKMIFTGDPSQIDTPYLSATNNGLAWFTDLMRGDPLFASVYFTDSVRSLGVRTVLKRVREKKL